MEMIRVVFNSMEECERYVKAVENFPFHIDLKNGRRIIDGKSMLGILGFGLRKVLEIRIHTEETKQVKELLEKISFCICDEKMQIAI